MRSYSQLSTLAIVTLVVLRVAVGWHFFKEGATKVQEGGFSSVGFLGAAVGPMAPFFQSLIPDHDGAIRTDAEKLYPRIDEFSKTAATKYGFDDKQKARLNAAVDQAKETIEATYAQWSRELVEYKTGFDRLQAMQNDDARMNTASLAAQKATVEQEWKGKVKPVLSGVDKALDVLAATTAAIATPEQRARAQGLEVQVADGGLMSVALVDKIIPIFDMVVGILLVIGLLTPVAGIAAGLFLVSVVLTQFPGAVGAQPTYYQAIEAAACFVLAFADAGRYAGLDFIPWAYWQRKKANQSSAGALVGTKAATA